MADTTSLDQLKALLRDHVAEGISCDFKEALPGGTDAEKREFLADVTSFANTHGGVIYFGVAESDGVAQALPGVPLEDSDAAILRLDSLLRDSVKPRILGIRIGATRITEGRVVIVVSIPRSLQSPHMVTFGGGSRFFGRNSAGKYQLDVDELRSAFLASASAGERVARFRAERLLRIQADDTPLPLDAKERLVLHVLPVLRAPTGIALDPREVLQLQPLPKPIWADGQDYRFNLNGVVIHGSADDDGSTHSYLQVFRDGSFESVCTAVLRPGERGNFIRSLKIEPLLFDFTRDYLEAQRALGIEGPQAVMVSLLGIRGYRVLPKTANRDWESFRLPIPQNDLILPEVVVPEGVPDTVQLLRPICDMIWQAAGWDSCRNYDEAGKWTGE